MQKNFTDNSLIEIRWHGRGGQGTVTGAKSLTEAVQGTGKFVVIGGDGGTYDIGLQSLSGAFERGHDLCYICYDNGAYMNTGIQRSGATPLGASTMTSPASEADFGKNRHRKDLTLIMMGHNIDYVAQASIHDPIDLSNKIKKGIETDGPAFINIISPCIPGWKIESDMAVEMARMAVETCHWPLYEFKKGLIKINYRPKKHISMAEWMFVQGRFNHLKDPKWGHVIESLQKETDAKWAWLLDQEAKNPAE
ncbi:MAG: thiamine pyrophosphate-dependent enzyme [Spirochaetes bacterium]|jgi:pyruvate ferredoxin oxidoreductase beta subunit|nr:thiamine pyrophosphate-dependent enzyme [Spirochaetota bacterium]